MNFFLLSHSLFLLFFYSLSIFLPPSLFSSLHTVPIHSIIFFIFFFSHLEGMPSQSAVVEIDAQDGKNIFYLPKGTEFTAVMSPGDIGSDCPRRDDVPVCLSVCVSVLLSVSLSIYRSVCPFISLSLCLSMCLSIYLSVCPFISLSLCLSMCLSIYLSVFLSMCICLYDACCEMKEREENVSMCTGVSIPLFILHCDFI